MRRGKWMSVVLITIPRVSSSMPMMPRQTDHLLFVITSKITSQGHNSGRKLVVDPAAGCAKLLVPGLQPRHPPPTPVLIDDAALRTDRALMQFLLNLIGVEDVILLGVSGNAACGPRPSRPEVRLDPLARRQPVSPASI